VEQLEQTNSCRGSDLRWQPKASSLQARPKQNKDFRFSTFRKKTISSYEITLTQKHFYCHLFPFSASFLAPKTFKPNFQVQKSCTQNVGENDSWQ
jgi:hypothetical protein